MTNGIQNTPTLIQPTHTLGIVVTPAYLERCRKRVIRWVKAHGMDKVPPRHIAEKMEVLMHSAKEASS